MPLIYHFKCDNCGHEHFASESGTYVILEDGSEKICPHPGEFRTAEKATGKTWSELVKGGRIIYRYPLICHTCGDLDYYGPHDLNIVMPPQSHLGSIVHRPTGSVAKLYECRSCTQRTLVSLARFGQLPGTSMSMVGGRKHILNCRQCEEGEFTLLPGAVIS
jgi:hypothetical protein